MKKLFLMAVVAIATVTNIWGQKFPDGYLTDETYPSYDFVPAPPSLTSGEFAYDFYHYQTGRNLREVDGISEQALFDESAQLYQVFDEEVIGFNLSRENTPEIILLCERAVSDASKGNTTVKKKYERIRPFATFHDPSLKPETDDEEAKTFSYPSGHSSSALFANVVCTEAYQQQLKKAREEYQNLKNGTVSVPQAKIVEHPAASSQAYTTNGIAATDSSRGIIIQNGRKALRK